MKRFKNLMCSSRRGSSSYHLLFICTVLLLLSLHVTEVKADIADCIIDKDCRVDEDECCARMIVEDSSGNYIDSHFCLQRPIINELGNRYYFKGILGRAYCDVGKILEIGGAIVGMAVLAVVNYI